MTNLAIVPLHELESNQEADFFALLSEKEHLKTKEGKPYIKVAFRDAKREVRFPVWSDTAIYKDIKSLRPGMFCKLRAVFRVSTYGPQLEIRRIRQAGDEDLQDGFDPAQLRVGSAIPPDAMFDELQSIALKEIGKGKLLNLVTKIFKDHRQAMMLCPAARQHHHAYCGGLLEHSLSVAKIALALVDHYHDMYPERKTEISRGLVVAGAMLHDIGKIREMVLDAATPQHSTEGELIGHAILGRDFVRDVGREVGLDQTVQSRLEHILISHQRFPDWGAAKPPMSLEALLVHHADSCDAMVGTYRNIVAQDSSDNELTSKKNLVGYPILKTTK